MITMEHSRPERLAFWPLFLHSKISSTLQRDSSPFHVLPKDVAFLILNNATRKDHRRVQRAK